MIKLVLTALVAVFLYASPAYANYGMMCAPRDKYVDLLTKKYGESVRVTGMLKGNKGIMEVWQGKTGSWSILMTLPSGQSCMVAAGDDLEVLKPPLSGSPS